MNIFVSCVSAIAVVVHMPIPVHAQNANLQRMSPANTQSLPRQILKTGVDLNTAGLSPNTLQLARTLELTPVIERLHSLREQLANSSLTANEALVLRQDVIECTQRAILMLQKADLEIDYTLAEIDAEQNVYGEILTAYMNDRDKTVARVNAASFISNGALWSANGALAIPTWLKPKYAISAGIVGITAGLVPSLLSLYTLKAINGKERTSEVEPNMLAKIFDYPITSEIDYPRSVWSFLTQSPAGGTNGRTRREQLIDRWIADSNIPAFTDATSRKQLDVITGCASQKKGLSIATLNARTVMLEQLGAEINKMKRMLLEINMAVLGEKQMVASVRLPSD